jgi:hypothetical protein
MILIDSSPRKIPKFFLSNDRFRYTIQLALISSDRLNINEMYFSYLYKTSDHDGYHEENI